MDAPDGLAERGSALWKALTTPGPVSAGQAVLIGEACRAVDRLDQLDLLLRGDVATWCEVYAPDRGEVVLLIDKAAAEARQLQTTLTQMLKALGALSGDAAPAVEDELERIRRARTGS